MNSDLTKEKCLGFTEKYKHCKTCKGATEKTRRICFSTSHTMAKPCQDCGGYYPGDCRCPHPCYCDSCNSQRHIETYPLGEDY